MTRKRTTRSAPNPDQVELDLPVDLWYPKYVRDWLSGARTFRMNNRQRGALEQLRCHAWMMDASLPDDDVALAKYADESVEWLRSPEGQAVLSFWPVDADGMRRDPEFHRLYLVAKDRRSAAQQKAKMAAAARWGKRDEPEPEQQSEPTPAVAPLRSLPAEPTPLPDRLQRIANRLPTQAGRDAFAVMIESIDHNVGKVGAAMEVGALLDGLRGKCTPEQVEFGLQQYVANGISDGKFNAMHLAGFIRRGKDATAIDAPAGKTAAEQSEAGVLVMRIRGLTQHKGSTQFIPRAAVEALGPRVLYAYDQVGGAKRFTEQKAEHIGFLTRDFELALKAASTQEQRQEVA